MDKENSKSNVKIPFFAYFLRKHFTFHQIILFLNLEKPHFVIDWFYLFPSRDSLFRIFFMKAFYFSSKYIFLGQLCLQTKVDLANIISMTVIYSHFHLTLTLSKPWQIFSLCNYFSYDTDLTDCLSLATNFLIVTLRPSLTWWLSKAMYPLSSLLMDTHIIIYCGIIVLQFPPKLKPFEKQQYLP